MDRTIMKLRFDKLDGLIPAIVQDYHTHQVLMLAFMDEAAWNKTIESGKAAYYSRSRKKSWIKGEESGNFQIVKEIHVDCDEDTVLLRIEQVGGAACHEGFPSCFYRIFKDGELQVTQERVFDPATVYKKK
jgi:phosphoribosyl-AMP cyclohydrolase